MNIVPEQKKLNDAFKRCQRLPDWPLANIDLALRISADPGAVHKCSPSRGLCLDNVVDAHEKKAGPRWAPP